jgi:hypothetical protein
VECQPAAAGEAIWAFGGGGVSLHESELDEFLQRPSSGIRGFKFHLELGAFFPPNPIPKFS